jgi:hypothetical protein
MTITDNHDKHVIHAFTDEPTPMPVRVPISAVHVLRPITKRRSPSLAHEGWFELIYAAAGSQPARALVRFDDIARAIGWHETDARNEQMARHFLARPFRDPRQDSPPSAFRAMEGEPMILAEADTSQRECLGIRLEDVRVVRWVGARHPGLAITPSEKANWMEMIFVRGSPARPYRAWVWVQRVIIGLGWHERSPDHNRPIAEAYARMPFYPERGEALRRSRPETTQAAITALLVPAPATFARAGFMARVRAMEEDRRRQATAALHEGIT